MLYSSLFKYTPTFEIFAKKAHLDLAHILCCAETCHHPLTLSGKGSIFKWIPFADVGSNSGELHVAYQDLSVRAASRR